MPDEIAVTAAIPHRRILFATIGSLGDLHPCIALGVELQRRGHRVTIATTEFYRAKVTEAGLGFHPMRPAWDPTDQALIAQCEDLRTGPEVLFRRLVLPHLKDMYADLSAAAADVDLLIAGEMVFAAPLVAEKTDLRWASIILSPCSFLSAHDPSVLVNVPWLIRLRRASPSLQRAVVSLGLRMTRHWWKPVRTLRKEIGVGPGRNPIQHDKFSPRLNLALFSTCFAQPQPDWPASITQPGFVMYEHATSDEEASSALREFLAAGTAPIVFTLGSTAVNHPGNFYAASAEAAHQLNRRAVLLGAPEDFATAIPNILTMRDAPYAEIFPHAAVIVHQGGSGTTGAAMLAGRPQLIVPYGWDQPDNGARIQRMGAGLTIARTNYSAESAATAIKRLLSDARIQSRAANIAARMRKETPLQTACDAMEAALL